MLCFPDFSTVFRGVPRVLASAPKRSQAWLRCTQAYSRCSQILSRPAAMPSNGPILSWNWHIYVYTPNPLRNYCRCPVEKIHSADVIASPNSLDHGLLCIPKLSGSSPCKWASELTLSGPPSSSLSSLDLGPQLTLQTRSMVACQGISKLDWSLPPSTSSNSLDNALEEQ